MKSVSDLGDLSGQRVLIRCDLNVPLDGDTITDDGRIRASLPTLNQLREAGAKPVRREGERDGRWVLLDYGEVVVHVQHAEEREFYALERLWRDCPAIAVPQPGPPAPAETPEA